MTSRKIYRLSRYRDLLVLQASVGASNGNVRKVRLLVDTGSVYTTLPLAIIEDLGSNLVTLGQRRILTGGGPIAAPVVAVPWFSCLGERLENFPIVAHTLPATTFVDGLLGIDFLSRLGANIAVREGEIRI